MLEQLTRCCSRRHTSSSDHGSATSFRRSQSDTETLLCSWTYRWGTALTLLLVVLWPVLALPAKAFSKGYFTFWTIIAIVRARYCAEQLAATPSRVAISNCKSIA